MFESSHPDSPAEAYFMCRWARPLTTRLSWIFGRRARRGRPRLITFENTISILFVVLPAMHYVYIIESLSTGKWYYGSTRDLDERLMYHNNGWNRSTKGRGPWKYIFAREFQNGEEARVFEFHLKKLRRKAYIVTKYSEYFIESADTSSPACPDEMRRRSN